MPATWALTFSPEWPTKRPVGAVFSCVASRDKAPGCRDAGNNKGFGAVRGIGGAGYIWSLSVAGTDTYYLGFSYGGINPQSYSGRAYGFQLRCLQKYAARHSNRDRRDFHMAKRKSDRRFSPVARSKNGVSRPKLPQHRLPVCFAPFTTRSYFPAPTFGPA